MPVRNFLGATFVAFVDISGFKEMMKGDGSYAVRALDKLNQAGYDILRNNHNINGFFISDCGILFVNNPELSKRDQLMCLLDVVRSINRALIKNDIILTTCIAFGQFSYHQRLEFEGIEKNPIYGNAYVAAFLDSEMGKPKIQPGQCRILDHYVNELNLDQIDLIEKSNAHFYYYWMADGTDEISDFKNAYSDAYRLRYQGILSALKRNR